MLPALLMPLVFAVLLISHSSVVGAQNNAALCDQHRLDPGSLYDKLDPRPEPTEQQMVHVGRPSLVVVDGKAIIVSWNPVIPTFLDISHPVRRIADGVGRLALKFEVSPGTYCSSFCTAAAISSSYLLTNYHCIPSTKINAKLVESKFLMHYYSEGVRQGTAEYDVTPRPEAGNSDYDLDFSVVKILGQRSGEPHRIASIPLQIRKIRPHENLQIVQHPNTFPMKVQRGCAADSIPHREGNLIYYNCSTFGGSSGAPIFSEGADTVLLGLHHTGNATVNRGSAIEAIVAKSPILQGLVNVATVAPQPNFNLTTAPQYNPIFAGIAVAYYRKKADGSAVTDALASVRAPYAVLAGRAEHEEQPTNGIRCGPETPIESVRTVALALIDKGVRLKVIDTSPTIRARQILIVNFLEDGRTVIQTPNITREQIKAMTSCSLP